MPTNRETLDDYVGVLKRRWKPVATTGLLTLLTFAVIAFALPAVYESYAKLLIEQPDLPENVMDTAKSTGFTEERLQAVQQRVLAAERVAPILRRHGLYRDLIEAEELQVAVTKFRENTTIEPAITSAVDPDSLRTASLTYAFVVRFQDGDPKVARDVAQSLAESFVEQSEALRTESASRSVEFLRKESERLKTELEAMEARLASFKKQFGANLPDTRLLSMNRAQEADRELARVEEDLRAARANKSLLETRLADTPRYRAVLSGSGEPVLQGADRLAEAQRELVALRAKYSDDHPSVVRLRREIESLSGAPSQSPVLVTELRTELAARLAELDAARQRYSENHPTVVNLKGSVDALQRQLAELSSSPASFRAPDPTNPLYLELQAQIRSADIAIAELSSRRGSYLGQMAQYKSGLLEAPQVERDYNNLIRDYDLTQEQYKELRSRQSRAEIAQKAGLGEDSERYVIVDPAQIITSPIKPDRLALLFLGVVLATAAALATAAIAEAMDRSVRGARDVYDALGESPLAVIPEISHS